MITKSRLFKPILLTFAALMLGIVANAQVNLSLRNVKVSDAITALNRAQGYSVSVNSGDVDLNKVISVNASGASITDAGQQVSYVINGKSISVSKGEPKAKPSQLTGVVVDENGEALMGAGILGQANNPITIDACENYGTILSDMIKASTIYMGAILGNANSKAVTIKNCKVGGKVGPLTPDADFQVVTLAPDNFEKYITLATSKAGNCKFEGNVCGN